MFRKSVVVSSQHYYAQQRRRARCCGSHSNNGSIGRMLSSSSTVVPSLVVPLMASSRSSSTLLGHHHQQQQHKQQQQQLLNALAATATPRRFQSSAAATPAPPPHTPPGTKVVAGDKNERDNVRNIAVIAHVDHGKTTLVDSMLKQSGTLEVVKDRIMDSKDQEKERGITILAKNTSVLMEGASNDPQARRINIVDTPGHLDFSGEVERALQMVEGFLLLVDAKEGVRPGTRYVLRKALALGLRPMVILNKIDKDDTNVEKTVDAVQDLFLELCDDSDQLDHMFFLYGSGRAGYMNTEPLKEGTLQPLFDSIFTKIPPPHQNNAAEPLQFLVAQVDEDAPTKQKVVIGRIFRGYVKVDDVVSVVLEGKKVNAMVKQIKLFLGVLQQNVSEAGFGDICALYLMEPVAEKIPLHIGATVCAQNNVIVYPYKKPDEPTYTLRLKKTEASWKGKETTDNMSMLPFITKRLEREAMVNTALQLEGLGGDLITMMGRGPLHLSVIIEDMRREGFEFEILAPSVILKTINGEVHEPFENVTLEFNEKLAAPIISLLSQKMADIGDIKQLSGGRQIVESVMPVRLMTNLPTQFHTMTSGDGVLNHFFEGYRPRAALESERETGALISVDSGRVEDYSLAGHQAQGRFFVSPGDDVFYGQIVGENIKTKLQNLGINVSKKNEQQGGFRANANDKANRRVSNYDARTFTFEDCIAWAIDDEVITVTPKSIRMRKPNFNGKTSMRTLSKNK